MCECVLRKKWSLRKDFWNNLDHNIVSLILWLVKGIWYCLFISTICWSSKLDLNMCNLWFKYINDKRHYFFCYYVFKVGIKTSIFVDSNNLMARDVSDGKVANDKLEWWNIFLNLFENQRTYVINNNCNVFVACQVFWN